MPIQNSFAQRTAEPEPLAYDIAAACRVSTIGKTRIYELIKEGRLESRRIGRRRVVLADSLRRLLAEGC